jgi:hypothetical protein
VATGIDAKEMWNARGGQFAVELNVLVAEAAVGMPDVKGEVGRAARKRATEPGHERMRTRPRIGA